MRLRKLIEALAELSVQRGPDIDVKTMPVFMFDAKGKKPGVCSFYVGEQTQLSPSTPRRTRTSRTIILEVS